MKASVPCGEVDPGAPVRIGRRFQGPTGSGQGGWTAYRFAEQLGEPVEVSLRRPVPLETDLFVTVQEVGAGGRRWVLDTDPHGSPSPVMVAVPTGVIEVGTDPVTIDEARRARAGFAHPGGTHPVPHCFSCGLQPESMRVHAAELDAGRYATDWTVPGWAELADGGVDGAVVWAALDCASAWYVCRSRGERTAVTARYTAEIVRPIQPGATYAVVAWAGDAVDDWVGRKRHAAAMAFDAGGACVARAVSLWVAVDDV